MALFLEIFFITKKGGIPLKANIFQYPVIFKRQKCDFLWFYTYKNYTPLPTSFIF